MNSRISVVCVLVLLWLPQVGQAQTVSKQSDGTFDRVRLAGLWWVGTLDGRISPRDFEALPRFIELEDLGITDTESGWMGEGDFGLARRHRVRVSGSDRSSDGMTTLTVNADIGGIEIPVQVPITSSLAIREFEATYKLVIGN